MSYNLIDDHPLLKMFVALLVGALAAYWISFDVRALSGAARIRLEKIKFEPCLAADVETFLNVDGLAKVR